MTWFQQPNTTSGYATLECTTIPGIIEGPATIAFGHNGKPDIQITIERFHAEGYPGDLFTFLQAAKPRREGRAIHFDLTGIGTNQGTLTITTTDGTYTGTKIYQYGGRLGGTANTINPHLTDFTFTTKHPGKPHYLILPISEFSSTWPILTELIGYPLLPNPEQPGGIRFTLFGKPAYIQPSNEHAGLQALLTTELPTGTNPSLYWIRQEFPFEILAALRFATGTSIRVPWIEIRDEHAQLLTRYHVGLGRRTENGHTFLDFTHGTSGSGLGHFLDQFLEHPPEHRKDLMVAMNLAVNGTPGTSTVDDNLVMLCRSIELLAKHHRVRRMNLRNHLTPSVRAQYDSAFTIFSSQLSSIRRDSRIQRCREDDRLLERIQSKHANAHADDADFGVILGVLLRRTNLPDAAVLETYMETNFGGKTWTRVISELRQDSIHEGYLKFRQKHDLNQVFALLRHLHDLTARLIFVSCGYEARYSPGLGSFSADAPIRWVTESTAPVQLLILPPSAELH